MVSCDVAERSRLRVKDQTAWYASVEGKLVTAGKKVSILLYRFYEIVLTPLDNPNDPSKSPSPPPCSPLSQLNTL